MSSPEGLGEFDAYPAVIKAQVLIGGRGKAGGIRFAADRREARELIADMLGMEIRGHPVRSVLVEPKLDIRQEIYLGITIDRSARAPLLMASVSGGVEIEEVPDDTIVRVHIPPLVGLQPYVVRTVRKGLALPREVADQVADVARHAYECFKGEDGELVEVNPLAWCTDGKVVAGDAKLVVDDNAEYRHQEYAGLDQDRTPLEQEAQDKGITFLQLPGDIGVIANGAGLTMATLDVLSHKGGRGGTFLDLGGTDDPETVKEAFEILLKADPSVIFLNIFGGITKADTVALGVKEAFEGHAVKVPVVARIKGVNEDRAKAILADAGMHSAESIEEGAELAVSLRGSR